MSPGTWRWVVHQTLGSRKVMRPKAMVHAGRLTAVALVVASGLLLLLAIQHRTLRLEHREALATLRSPHPGQWYPVVETRSVTGDTVCIGYGASWPQLVIFVTGDCESCAEALKAWSATAALLPPARGAQVLSIALDDARAAAAFVEAHDVRVPVVAMAHPRWREAFRIREVPYLVLLDPEGRVRVARSGDLQAHHFVDSITNLLAYLQPTGEAAPTVARCGGAAEFIHLHPGAAP